MPAATLMRAVPSAASASKHHDGLVGSYGTDGGYESALHSHPSDYNSDPDRDIDEDDDTLRSASLSTKSRGKARAQRPKFRTKQAEPEDDDVDTDASSKGGKQPRRKPASKAKTPAQPSGKAAKPKPRRSRSKKYIITPADRKILQCVGEKCEWNDALLALGTKELNTVLKKGSFTTKQMEELKSARRRAKNRTYALRSRQKRDGKDMAPCPGTAESMELVAKEMEVQAEAATAAAAEARMKARKAVAKAAINSKKKEASTLKKLAVSTAKATNAKPTSPSPRKKLPRTKTEHVAGPAVFSEPVIESDDELATAMKWESVQGIPYTSGQIDPVDSDTESLSSFLSETLSESGDTDTDWSSSSFTDTQYESDFDSANDSSSASAPDFEFAAMSLDPPESLTVTNSDGSVDRQPSDLETMMAELAGLKNDYTAVHSKLDQLASNLESRTSRLVDGSVGIPAVSVAPTSRVSGCATPTPTDTAEPTVVLPQWAASDPLFVDIKSGFQSLSSKMDAWFPKDDAGADCDGRHPDSPRPDPISMAMSPRSLISSGSMFDFVTPLEESAACQHSHYDHFTAAMLGTH